MKTFLSNFVSVALVPLLIPAYLFGIVLFLFPEMAGINLLNEKTRLIFEVLAFTAFFPLLAVYLLYKFKVISSLSLIRREDRLLPQLISLVLFGIFAFLLFANHGLKNVLTLILIANTTSLIMMLIITQFFKISAHTSGAAGFIVITSILCLKPHSINYLILYLFIVMLSVGVFFARLYLKAHTLKQVIYGGVLGFLSGVCLVFYI
ncbi:MAG: phosphatase PAP2 family protein [Prolixibacteraceae bacterium]